MFTIVENCWEYYNQWEDIMSPRTVTVGLEAGASSDRTIASDHLLKSLFPYPIDRDIDLAIISIPSSEERVFSGIFGLVQNAAQIGNKGTRVRCTFLWLFD